MADVIVDASALVDLLLGGPLGAAVRLRLTGHSLHTPAHADAEILSALGRLHRAGHVSADVIDTALARLSAAPFQRHLVADLLAGAWSRRHQVRLADAIYIELAVAHDMPLITTDSRLAPVPAVEVVTTS